VSAFKSCDFKERIRSANSINSLCLSIDNFGIKSSLSSVNVVCLKSSFNAIAEILIYKYEINLLANIDKTYLV